MRAHAGFLSKPEGTSNHKLLALALAFEMTERNSLNSQVVASGSSRSVGSARWKARDDETGWQRTHGQIVKYRSENNVTIKGFLALCGLPPKSYYLQLCSQSGSKIHPVNAPGSVGGKFLDAVAKFFEEQPDCPPRVLRMDEIVTDLNMDHMDDLHNFGIVWLGMDVDQRKLSVTCSATVDETKFKEYLREAELEVDGLQVEFRHLELLYAPPVLPSHANGMSVGKIDHATGLTQGTTVDVDDSHMFVESQGPQGSFADHGDSGGLVYLEEIPSC